MLAGGLVMPQLAEQLIGRAAELGVIDSALADLERRSFGALELVGEPGIGKTRLLGELAARADAQGHLVLSGSASELERELPFWIFVDALDEYLESLEPRRKGALDDDLLADIAPVFPSLADGAEQAGGDERYRVHRGMRLVLEELAATKPLVLLLDDVHWADPASAELLGSLLRRPPAAAVLLGVALRPRQVPDALAGTLARAESGGGLQRIELAGLSQGEARELLGAAVSAKAAASLYAESSGNPFYLQQLARSPLADRHADGRPDVAMAGVEVPQAVAAALTGELALLAEEHRRVLEGAAVAGDPFEPELAAAAAGVTEEAALTALDELLARDLVRQTEVPRRFRFRHPLVRGAVYEAAPGGWRLTAHERAAAALAERGAPASARAHHVERSARHGDAEAIALLTEAGQAAVGRAPASAGRLFEAALRLLPESAPALERAALLDQIAGAHTASGWFARAYEAMCERLDLPSDEPLPHRVRLIAAIASLENLIGRNQQAHARLVRALDELPDQTSEEAIAILIELGIDGFFRMDYSAMWEYEQRALEAARALGDKILMATPAGILAFGQVMDGRFEEAAASAAAGAELIDSFSDEELARCRRATNNVACAELYLERYAEAERHSERALAVALATGQGQFVPILFWTGMIRTARGRLAEAAELQDAAIEVARLSGHAQGIAWNLGSRAITATAAGDVEGALAAAEEAVEAAAVGTQGPTFPAMWIYVSLGAALVEAGDARRATEIVLQGAGGEELPLLPSGWRPSLFELLTRAALLRGSRVDAVKYAERAAAYADEQRMLRLPRAWAQRAAAEIALADGDPAGAAPLALEAAAAAAEVDHPIEEALGRMLAGRAFAAAGERERATAELTAAAGIFERCGALPRRDAVDRELGKLGKRVHRRTKRGKLDGTGIEQLTERELEVARLVVDRKTNSQIAAELFLSPKTVETHIRHLFQKLEVSSRVEVARVVERAEREEGTLTR
jgi:DNA-binding CsgD family transcriptional regulator/tetratricopeptide (TPR) repeat protein